MEKRKKDSVLKEERVLAEIGDIQSYVRLVLENARDGTFLVE